mgnify:FL=1
MQPSLPRRRPQRFVSRFHEQFVVEETREETLRAWEEAICSWVGFPKFYTIIDFEMMPAFHLGI